MAVHYIRSVPSYPIRQYAHLIMAGAESALPRALACRTVYDIAELAEGRSFRGSATRRRDFRFRG